VLYLSTALNGGSGNIFHPYALEWPTSFSIPDPQDGTYVDYQLAGRFYFSNNHFTTEMLVEGEWHFYNDRDDISKYGGTKRPGFEVLQPIESPTPPGGGSSTEPAASIYVRVSEKKLVSAISLSSTQ
jgi:hypothetical protein